MPKTGKLLRATADAWLIVGIGLLLFALAEASLYGVFALRDKVVAADPTALDHRAGADTYAEAVWVGAYFREFVDSWTVRWEPYVYWRREPYRGEYINVTDNGLRRTSGRAAATEGEPSDALRVFVFGGSTVWGTGARDDFTIPAHLARELDDRGVEASVTNFGESGYVSAQELAALVLELRQGRIPDVVIFYDGVNDTFSAFQQGVAGLPMNEFRRVQEFNLSSIRRDEVVASWVRSRLAALSTLRLARGVLRRAGLVEDTPDNEWSHPNAPEDDAQREELARDVLRAYANTVKVVRALAGAFGFDALFYWQPTLFGKRLLTDYEQRELDLVAGNHESFFELTYSLMQREGELLFTGTTPRDLSAVFSDVGEPIYIDWMHLGERGNGRIAREMAQDVMALPRVRGAD